MHVGWLLFQHLSSRNRNIAHTHTHTSHIAYENVLLVLKHKMRFSLTYHSKEVVVALNLSRYLWELLIEGIRDVMGRICGNDEDTLPDSSQLDSQTTARKKNNTERAKMTIYSAHANFHIHQDLCKTSLSFKCNSRVVLQWSLYESSCDEEFCSVDMFC